MQQIPHCAVVVVGAGPTGLILANLLGVYGVQTVLIERNADLVDQPRAVTIDDESLRTLQATGLIDDVLRDVVQGYGVHYFSWTGQLFARIEPTSTEYGYPKRNAFRQQVLVRQLKEGLQRFAHVRLLFEHELIALNQDQNRVRLTLQHGGLSQTLDCDYLVACDGGRSSVREHLGIELKGSSYAEQWLIVDLLDRSNPFRHTRTYCDPERPAIRLPGPHGVLRYEFMLHPGEVPEQVLDEDQIRHWIAQREPADARLTIARKVVYGFQARVAERWREGRVFLAGDAAHLTPPFAGQGMNSGVRDAANLAWKLAAVLKAQLSPRLLLSYETERKPHASALIKMAQRIGRFMQPKSVFSALLTQGALKLCSLYPPARDYVLQLKFKPKPRFLAGFFVSPAGPPPVKQSLPPGQLLSQPWVELAGGKRVRLDEVLGQGFAALSWAAPASGRQLGLFQRRGIALKQVHLLRQNEDFLAVLPESIDAITLRDCEGVLATLLDQAGYDTLLLRPDRYLLAYLNQDEPLGWNELERLLNLGVHFTSEGSHSENAGT
ncbi:MAG: bifunctional 3-(3-hydroxy-phenyl)propionate/3-hydroxycinnamic acid hydroxylase [Burkholderiaceae bacterium]